MIPRDRLPEDAALWSTVSVAFPRLGEDKASSCPISETEIFKYVQQESADSGLSDRARLVFIRTARLDDAAYWLWQYTEGDGSLCSVVFRQNDDGSIRVTLCQPNGLSYEQLLLADYYDEIYWS